MTVTLPATNRPRWLRHVAPIATSSTLATIAALHVGWGFGAVPPTPMPAAREWRAAVHSLKQSTRTDQNRFDWRDCNALGRREQSLGSDEPATAGTRDTRPPTDDPPTSPARSSIFGLHNPGFQRITNTPDNRPKTPTLEALKITHISCEVACLNERGATR